MRHIMQESLLKGTATHQHSGAHVLVVNCKCRSKRIIQHAPGRIYGLTYIKASEITPYNPIEKVVNSTIL